METEPTFRYEEGDGLGHHEVVEVGCNLGERDGDTAPGLPVVDGRLNNPSQPVHDGRGEDELLVVHLQQLRQHRSSLRHNQVFWCSN